MHKINLFVKIPSWIFVFTGIIEIGIVGFLFMEGDTALSDFFASMFIESTQDKVLFIAIVLARMLIAVLGIIGIEFEICLGLTFVLIIKNVVYMYHFSNTYIYMFLYRSIPELLLVLIYTLGIIHFAYEET